MGGCSSIAHQHPLGTRPREATRQMLKLNWKAIPNGCIVWLKPVQTLNYTNMPPTPRPAVLQYKVANR